MIIPAAAAIQSLNKIILRIATIDFNKLAQSPWNSISPFAEDFLPHARAFALRE